MSLQQCKITDNLQKKTCDFACGRASTISALQIAAIICGYKFPQNYPRLQFLSSGSLVS